MDMLSSLLPTIFVMFLYLAIGYIARKVGFVDEVASKKLSRFVLSVSQPFMIVNAVISTEYSKENLTSGLSILGLGFLVQAFAALIAFLACKGNKDQTERRIMEVTMIFANCGFIGFPLVEALYGAKGLFWGAFYVISFNMLCWTYGLFTLGRANPNVKMKPIKLIWNFGTTPCLIGFALFLLRVQLPPVVMTAVRGMSNLSTPLTLVVAGGLIATIPLKKLLTRPKVYYSNLFRLLIIPIAAALLLKLLRFPDEYVTFGALMAGLPTGAVTAMFAETYDMKPDFAAHIVGMSTLLILVTMPAVMAVTGWILLI